MKLAIQATHGVKRDVSFQSLMSLQLQFCIGAREQNVPASDLSNAYHRMSRIITKLFSRVLKAETNEINPFERGFDLDAVMRTLENVLSQSQTPGTAHSVRSDTSDLTDLDSLAGDKMAPCRSMCNTFMMDLLKAKNAQNKTADLKVSLRKHGYITETYAGKLFVSCCNELGLESLVSPLKADSSPKTPSVSYDSDQLSELIFAVGDAEEDEDRVNAIDDLRDFMDGNPGIDLESHLSGLSEPFRKYIMEQMRSPFRPSLRQSERSLLSGFSSVRYPGSESSPNNAGSEANGEQMSMSEKLRYLKSKINAAEESAQSFIQPGSTNLPQPPAPEKPSSPTTSNSFSSLKQRLAAASEKRAYLSPPTVDANRNNNMQFESAAMGNAAILRARLESVKRMNSVQNI